ncbi:hypothetical protein BLA24_21045 [Streptomyces cinnamoneus]|uniref:Secreted protein n=1 Tax=Streptomyces cinnamoneus TaxID=53446 RepID=A0A2G1XFS0_STRCJ|nr:hypothetical protein [Streptomyces cinnamoneus]PHQ50084.1 hypothetical protein BLA24_21045 [Streptomyces cinnamoneus]PPT13135.1 hypothetical protein CYQ11_09740 [Streptomyces cinnamoneus]
MVVAAVTIALIFTILVVCAVIATVKAVRTVKRGVDRTVTQARRTVEDTRLKARQYTQPGPAGELAQLRLSLRASMRATQEVLRVSVAEDSSLSESLALFERLSAHGRELDEDLRKLEEEPDKARVATCLPELRERTERVRHAADSLRWAAQDRARQFAEDDLSLLSEQIRMETGALRHWEDDDGAAVPPASGAAGKPEEPRTGRTGAGAAAEGGTGGPASEEPARPALDGRNGSWQAGYPWQKAKRPEGTA